MDLTLFYELREQLSHAVIAGGRMLAEDYRLKRALDALAPMEKVSPIFGKIGQTVRMAMTAPSEKKGGYLLDALALLDAVLCTQAEVKVPANMKKEHEISEEMNGEFLPLPYSILHETLTALRTARSGHFAFLRDLYETKPEVFQDIRVKAAMVDALGTSYGGVSDMVLDWLKYGEDESIVPFIKKDFDKKTKREQQKRMEVLQSLADRGLYQMEE